MEVLRTQLYFFYNTAINKHSFYITIINSQIDLYSVNKCLVNFRQKTPYLSEMLDFFSPLAREILFA